MNAIPDHPLSEFQRLAGQVFPYRPDAVELPGEAVRNAALGAGLLLGSALAIGILPEAASVRHGGFFLLLAGFAAAVVGGLKALAGPVLVLGVACLLTDAFIWHVKPTAEPWLWVCLAQPWTGLAFLCGVLLFVALVLVNLAVWIAIGCFVLAVAAVVLMALGGGE